MFIDNKRYKAPPLLALSITALLFSTTACSDPVEPAQNALEATSASVNSDNVSRTTTTATSDNTSPLKQQKPEFSTQEVARFDEPWAMTALPKANNESPKLLVTQKTGELFIVDTSSGVKTQVSGVPKVAYGGQGGLGDIILAPNFTTDNELYLSYIEAGSGRDSGKYGAKVIKARLVGVETDTPSLQAITPIWEQNKKLSGQGHYSHRLLFSPDGRYLYISSGDRQQKDPAQDMSLNLGKIIRLNPDGSIPNDNPFSSNLNDTSAQFWTLGHRNVLGMAFDDNGRLWAHEMGPRGGDEFNLIKKAENYGWPIVSNGRNYSGTDIPDHDTRPEFAAPKITWTPVISPSSMSIYNAGSRNDFPAWQGDALISGLSSKALIVVAMNADTSAIERYRYDMGERIRSVLALDGEVWLLEDGSNAALLKLLPQ